MKVLITGHRGFVGGHVFRTLSRKQDLEVEGIDWPDDLRELRRPLLHDVVINLAAIGGVGRAAFNPLLVMGNNVAATMALRDCLVGKPLVIHVSSFSVYGDAPVPTTTDAPLRPKEIYGASKLAQELCWVGYDGPISILRPSSLYGAGMRLGDAEATVIAKMAGAAILKEVFEIFEDGKQERDFVHVSDLVDAVLALIQLHKKKMKGPAFLNVCSGRGVSILHACELLGTRAKITHVARPGDMRVCLGDPRELVELLGRDTSRLEDHWREILLGAKI